MSDEEFGKEEVHGLFKALTEALSTSRGEEMTEAIVSGGEARYMRISQMSALNPENGGKGYSTGGVARQVAQYAGLNWSAIDHHLSHVCGGIFNGMTDLTERMLESDDPDEREMASALKEDPTMYFVQNVAYHCFWTGYFTNEEAVESEKVSPVDMSAVPQLPLDVDEVLRLSATSLAVTISDIQEMESGDFDKNTHRLPSLGLTMEELIKLQKSATDASIQSLERTPDGNQPNDKDLNVYGMTLAMGIAIGRALERRGSEGSASEEGGDDSDLVSG